jgi:hypothetical protein
LNPNPNQCELFSDLNRALRSTQSQMDTRAIWEVKAACAHDANTFTKDKSLNWWLGKNMVTNAIFPYALRGVTGILTYLSVCDKCREAFPVESQGKVFCH